MKSTLVVRASESKTPRVYDILRGPLGILSLLLGLAFFAPRALAKDPPAGPAPDFEFAQFDDNGDGKPDRATISCDCVTGRDTIHIYDGGLDMVATADPNVGADLLNDTWLYDIASDGTANLIVSFHRENGKQYADLYDDVNGDGKVNYRLIAGTVAVAESEFWTLRLSVEGGWYAEDGQLNLNLRALRDGPVTGTLLPQALARRYMAHDGEPDLSFELHDADRDGRPEYDLTRLLADIPSIHSVKRAGLHVNAAGTHPEVPGVAPFWPYLPLGPLEREPLRYFDVVPVVTVDWERSDIVDFGLPGYPVEHGYHINSLQEIEPGVVSDVDFEAPHAYYDLAGNDDGFPDLNVRLFYGYRPFHHPWAEVRYSWNQRNPGTLIWDYKVGLLGKHPDDEREIVDVGGLQLRMIPYARIPSWVTAREWLLTTFVAREHDQHRSSEGIYDWTPWSGANPGNQPVNAIEANEAAFQYASGQSDISPANHLSVISDGYRGEYAYARPMKPELYVSSIDGRLHLLWAEGGLYAVNQDTIVRYGNLNGDAYIDQWLKLQDETLRESIQYSFPYLYYAHENTLVVKRVAAKASLFQTRPPADHEEWNRLGQRLAEHGVPFTADDFAAIVDNLDGPTMIIEGADAGNFRALPESGLRFLLSLQPGFRLRGEPLFELPSTIATEYVVSGSDELQATVATPPELSLRLETATEKPRHAYDPGAVRLVISNTGLKDVDDVDVIVDFIHEHEAPAVISETRTLDVPGSQEVDVRLGWTPHRAGTWIIRAALIQGDQTVQQVQNSVPIEDNRHGLMLPAIRANLLRAAPWLLAIFALVGLMITTLLYHYRRQET